MASVSYADPGVKMTAEIPPFDAGPYVPPDPADDVAHAATSLSWDAPTAVQEPRLPLADWVVVQASLFRLQGSEAAEWLAGKIDSIASEVRRLHASTPEDFEDRAETEERWARECLAQEVAR
jgi:hypothetical protein